MVISILFKIGIVKIIKFLHTVSIDKKQIFQMKILDEINFFIIVILNPIEIGYLFSLLQKKVSVVH